MSKLPNHSLWARAATTSTSAGSSSRATSVLAKSHQHSSGSGSSSSSSAASSNRSRQRRHAQPSTSSAQSSLQSLPDAASLVALGAVSAPFYGPQPAAVVHVYEQHQAAAANAQTGQSEAFSTANFSFPTSLAFPTLAPWSQSLPSYAALRHAPAITATSSFVTLQRSMHSLSAINPTSGGQTVGESSTWSSFNFNPARRKQGKTRLIYDVSADTDHVKQHHEASLTGQAVEYQTVPPAPPSIDGSSGSEMTPHSSPVPSPRSTSPGAQEDVGHRSVFGSVSDPPTKFAVTTSAEGQIWSSDASGTGKSKASKASHVAATSSAAPQAASSGALPPQASAPAGSTDNWARTFNIPRSSKRHDFMFEHGAYGIPKRHPLSSIRASPRAGNSNASRAAPTRDEVPSGKIRAATDILSAAADFFVGSQHASNSSAKDTYLPFKGQDALQAALAGGSTAEEYELQPPSKSEAPRPGGVHRMAIRGLDGRIIKDRLRSVQVGEDAYFLRPDALGVADGVGGWASRPGADPALFSRLLMHFCAVELSRYDGLSASDLAADNGSLLKAWASVDPVEVMHRAWERCVRASRREGILGSSTALIGLLRGDELRIANMGDCVLMIIRQGEMLFRSTEQQHSFNFPVQLGMMGDTTDTVKKHVLAHQQQRERAAGEGEVASGTLEDYDAVEGETRNGGASAASNANGGEPASSASAQQRSANVEEDEEDEPEWDEPRRDAGRWTVRVEAGDIIVVGSDGLMDNLFDEDIIEEVLRFLPASMGGAESSGGRMDPSDFSPQLVSEALCSRAKAVSEDSRAISSPFQQRAMEEGLNYVGGKHDDISVVVCIVGERSNFDSDADSDDVGGMATGSSSSSGTNSTDASASNSDAEDSSTTAASSNASVSRSKKFLIK